MAGDSTHLDAMLAHLPRVFEFCARMTLDRAQAESACSQTFADAATTIDPAAAPLELQLLGTAARILLGQLPASPEIDFDLLDDTLRSEATRTAEISPLSAPDKEYLLWELKNGCLTSVASCLPPGERLAFILCSALGLEEEQAATVLGIRASAVKVRLSRARQKVDGYLAPRCGHVDPANPCQCPSRIGVAIRKGFIASRNHVTVRLRPEGPFREAGRQHQPSDLYATLPQPEIPSGLAEELGETLRRR